MREPYIGIFHKMPGDILRAQQDKILALPLPRMPREQRERIAAQDAENARAIQINIADLLGTIFVI